MKRLLIITAIFLGLILPTGVSIAASTDNFTGTHEGVETFLKNVGGGLSAKGRVNFTDKKITDTTGELSLRKIVIYIADRAISLFSMLAVVLLVIAGVSIIVRGSDPAAVAKQGINIVVILGSIFVMHMAKTIVAIFFQDRGIGDPITDILATVEAAKQGIVEPVIDLGLSFLAILAIAYLIYNSLMLLVNSSNDTESGEYQTNVLYGIAGLLIVMLARPIVKVFYDWNFERGSLGKPMEPDFNYGIEILFQLIRYALWILVFIAIGLIIATGYMMVTHFGNEGMITKAKNIITYVIIGFVIILSAYSLVAIFGFSII